MVLGTLLSIHHLDAARILHKRTLSGSSRARILEIYNIYQNACFDQSLRPSEYELREFEREYSEDGFEHADTVRTHAISLIEFVDDLTDRYHTRVIPEDRLENIPVFGLDSFLQRHTLLQQIVLEQKAVWKLVTWFERISHEERQLHQVIVNNFLTDVVNVLQRLQHINCFLAQMLHADISSRDMANLDKIFNEINRETAQFLPKSGSRRVRFRRDYILLIETERVLRAIVRSFNQLVHHL